MPSTSDKSAGQADHYAVLELPRNAEPHAVAAAYRRLARVYHPDVNTGPGAAERMRTINAAYAVLADPRLRAAYDARLHGGIESAGPVGTHPRTYSRTRLIGTLFVAVLAGFAALTCVLSSQVPLTTTAGGYVILPRATATALARGPISPASTASGASSASGALAATRGPIAIEPALGANVLLRRFPRPVLVPPAGVAPFAGLTLEASRISGTTCGEDGYMCVPRYVIDFGEWNPTGARLSAFGGRATFDSAAPRAAECAERTAACTVASVPGRPGATYVRDLSVRSGQPAVASVRACCAAPYWTLAWYDPASDTSYRLELAGAAATIDGTPDSVDSVEAANRLADIASTLVPLR
jgi:hypothetical protein